MFSRAAGHFFKERALIHPSGCANNTGLHSSQPGLGMFSTPDESSLCFSSPAIYIIHMFAILNKDSGTLCTPVVIEIWN
jgi:hypothetical protein